LAGTPTSSVSSEVQHELCILTLLSPLHNHNLFVNAICDTQKLPANPTVLETGMVLSNTMVALQYSVVFHKWKLSPSY